jgi:pyruvate formate lyase activating enzyme
MVGTITNIQRYSLNDGQGIRTIVFFKGCPLCCAWCSNPETQDLKPQLMFHETSCIDCMECRKTCPQKLELPAKPNCSLCRLCGACSNNCPTAALELIGKRMTVDEVLAEVEKDRPFYSGGGGMTLSGGEPLLQSEFASELAKKAQDVFHMHVAMETTGFAKWENLWQVAQYCDEILYDIKHMNSAEHGKYTGVGNVQILENLRMLTEKAADKITIRVPLIEGYNADGINIDAVGELAKKLRIKQVHLLPYHEFGEPKYKKLGRVYDFKGKTPSEDEIEARSALLQAKGLIVQVGG